ncbi:hypothetical protein [Bosea sp. UC22_33]|uniref:hypothetical protein n=1 Tax=Bosea sp. UC22_33 TaxID=3350165 RepID=UPI00366FDFB5
MGIPIDLQSLVSGRDAQFQARILDGLFFELDQDGAPLFVETSYSVVASDRSECTIGLQMPGMEFVSFTVLPLRADLRD